VTGFYEVDLTRAARRALAETLPLEGVRSARVMREWRILHRIDEATHHVLVQAIGHRRDIYRTR
jgi:mRNA-degrading endonuclease RelE of RelBE toxin-antitoxin system